MGQVIGLVAMVQWSDVEIAAMVITVLQPRPGGWCISFTPAALRHKLWPISPVDSARSSSLQNDGQLLLR
jgi:hypothetical protein